MSDKKKKLLNALFVALVFCLTIYSVFDGEDPVQTMKMIMQARPGYLLWGVGCVVFFIWGESFVIHYLFKTLNIKTKRRTCFMYSCIGFFFSCITPSASGGQPAQILYMKKNKIPVPVATLVLMIVTITYKLILVFVGLFLAIFQRGFVNKYLLNVLPVFYLGVLLNVFCCTFMLILVFHPDFAKKIMLVFLRCLERLHLLKKKPERTKRLEESMDLYHETASYLKKNLWVIFNVIAITFCQRFALFFVTYFVYRALGLSGGRMYDVVMLQAVISVSVDMLPLPGGMGISEHLFLNIFTPFFYGALLLPGMVLSRGIAYYAQLLLSGAVTLFAHFTIGRHRADTAANI